MLVVPLAAGPGTQTAPSRLLPPCSLARLSADPGPSHLSREWEDPHADSPRPTSCWNPHFSQSCGTWGLRDNVESCTDVHHRLLCPLRKRPAHPRQQEAGGKRWAQRTPACTCPALHTLLPLIHLPHTGHRESPVTVTPDVPPRVECTASGRHQETKSDAHFSTPGGKVVSSRPREPTVPVPGMLSKCLVN